MRGRKPAPTSRQISAGDPRKKGVNKLAEKLAGEPHATSGLPSCPRHLKGRARAAWGFWSEELAAMNLDRRPDAMMLEGACVAYQRAVQADEALSTEGIVCVVETVDPQTKLPMQKLKAHPAVAISNASWSQMRAFCSEFGLSPASRTRLQVEKKDDGEQDLMKILTQPRPAKQQPTVQ